MLVLSRKTGQEILIGDDISITVNKVSGDRVSIAIQAPRSYRIMRGGLKNKPQFEERVVSPQESRSEQDNASNMKDSAEDMNQVILPLGNFIQNQSELSETAAS